MLAPDGVSTIPEAADHLRVSPRQIYNLAERGDLRIIKIATSSRVPNLDLLRLTGAVDPGVRRLVDQAVEQGHPERVTDPQTVANVAGIVWGGRHATT